MKKAVFFIFCITSLSCRSITARNYQIETALFNNSSVRIVLISDLHSSIYGKDQQKLVSKIIECKPDIIILCGDIFDIKAPDTGTEIFLSAIRDIAPIYFVTGNHEYYHNIKKIEYLLGSNNVVILSDSYINLSINNNEMVIAGIDDPEKYYYKLFEYDQIESMEKNFRELDEIEIFKILIAHRPENIEKYKKFSFNLVLSGHAHGGQVRIPCIINGLYAPDQGAFPKYSGGIYQYDGLTHIISRGLSINHPKLPRIFNPPELVMIIISSTID